MPQLPLMVPKVWGREVWLVNEPEYCCKMLEVHKEASSSLHCHPVKKESFILVTGKISLECGDDRIILRPGPKAVTIPSGIYHRFKALKESVIMEISTHHEDTDVIRLEASTA